MSFLSEQCSVIIVPYNHREFIEECINSVLRCNPNEVLVVDGGSSDGTREIVREMGPPVDLITVEDNPGYGVCNNIGVEQATSEYILILNPDTKLEPETIERLLEPIDSHDHGPTVTSPKILTYDASRINTIGNINHITGFGFVQGFGDSPDDWSDPMTLTGVSGACFAIRKDDFQRLGGFDGSLFIYMEDVEFSWRLNAHNERIQFVPDAIVYHDYDEVVVKETKLRHLEFGRYIILKKYFDAGTTVLLLPSLLMAEILTFGFAASLGTQGLRKKIEAIKSAALTNVESVQVDSLGLTRRLDTEIALTQLNDSGLTTMLQRIAEFVFKSNMLLIEFIERVR